MPILGLPYLRNAAIRVLRSADVILSEDTGPSGKLLQYYNIKAQLLSYHKFNEAQREQAVLQRLKQGEIVALISDAGTPGISDPGTELAKLCAKENIDVIPIPGACAVVAALSASGLETDEFTFGTKLHEEFWRGSLGEAKQEFLIRQPKGEITLLIEGKKETKAENPTESQLEEALRELISDGNSLSAAVKMVAERTSMRKKEVYSLALKKFGKQIQVEDEADE